MQHGLYSLEPILINYLIFLFVLNQIPKILVLLWFSYVLWLSHACRSCILIISYKGECVCVCVSFALKLQIRNISSDRKKLKNFRHMVHHVYPILLYICNFSSIIQGVKENWIDYSVIKECVCMSVTLIILKICLDFKNHCLTRSHGCP